MPVADKKGVWIDLLRGLVISKCRNRHRDGCGISHIRLQVRSFSFDSREFYQAKATAVFHPL